MRSPNALQDQANSSPPCCQTSLWLFDHLPVVGSSSHGENELQKAACQVAALSQGFAGVYYWDGKVSVG